MRCTSRRAAEPRVFCSRKCKGAFRNQRVRLELEQSKPERFCRHCGAAIPKRMRADAAYCSAKCNAKAHTHTRKASRRAGAKQQGIDRAYIVNRDGGRCHLCGKKCSKAELTLDHLIPLALGGSHTSENLRVACRLCNVRKRMAAVNDQLLLFG